MPPIRLSDDELDAVFNAARSIDPDLRDPFLRAVAHALQQDCAGEIGPGTVARVCRELQRQFFSPPEISRARAAQASIAERLAPRRLALAGLRSNGQLHFSLWLQESSW